MLLKLATQIALRLNRRTSTITREVWNQVKVKRWCYSAVKGENLSKERKRKVVEKKKLDLNVLLLNYVQSKLKEDWSPEEIAKRIKIDYPKDNTENIT